MFCESESEKSAMKIIAHLDNTSFFAVDLLHQAAGAFLSGSSVGVGAADIPRSRPNSNNRAAHAHHSPHSLALFNTRGSVFKAD